LITNKNVEKVIEEIFDPHLSLIDKITRQDYKPPSFLEIKAFASLLALEASEEELQIFINKHHHFLFISTPSSGDQNLGLLRSLMDDHNMKAKDMVDLLGISKGYISDILNYKKGLSKDVIRKLSVHFKISRRHLTGLIN
jgi:antitoxin component HigA of HigAB toxin-antitoxin module